eukprot:TRINITY_DN10670_c0_g1_i1.p1 TRINITY_DN10670_c0_g1~~TRINITY_DN10670_c0_g1_i1.p1  ORF type:complete len:100 (+),score=20.12 TRINITY_DN10670_c0_g1_i1:86-385(+)
MLSQVTSSQGIAVAIALGKALLSLLFVVSVISLGWYAMWHFFLSKVGFIREIFGFQESNQTSTRKRRTSVVKTGMLSENRASASTQPSESTYSSLEHLD